MSSEQSSGAIKRLEPWMAVFMIGILSVAGVAIGASIAQSASVGLICAGAWILWRLKTTGGVLN